MSVETFERGIKHSEHGEREKGEIRFGEMNALTLDLRARRFVVARVEPARLRAASLRVAIDEAVEAALASRGALPPAVSTEAPIETTCADQIFRARALGAAGLAVICPPLERGATIVGDDSATLLAWTAAARAASVVVALDEADKGVSVLAPMALASLAPIAPRPAEPVSVEIEPDSISPDIEIEISPPPPAALVAGEPAPPLERAAMEALREEPAMRAARPRDRKRAQLRFPMERSFAPKRVEPATTEQAPQERVETKNEASAPREAPIDTKPSVSANVVSAAEWRGHAVELDRARGPKPIGVVEKLFGQSYLPLLGAIARGEADHAVRGVVDAWRASFEHSYRESFAALKVTAKRPPMVFDAPDIAAKVARKNGARKVVPVLVDAMRFDLAEKVSEALAKLVAGRAIHVEKNLLWAALPTNTPTQLHLLAHGAEGLREDASRESEPEIARGRAVTILRRERLGARDVLKLDLVEARIRGVGPAYDERLDTIAAEVANVLARFFDSCPPRTLVYLFGDHGFRLPSMPDGRATGPASQGGASPEEVLVAGDAWLVGDAH